MTTTMSGRGSSYLTGLVLIFTWVCCSHQQQRPFIPGTSTTTCNKHLDIVIAIDGSNSMYESNFKTEKAAIANLIRSLQVTIEDTHVGLVLFSTDIHYHTLSGDPNEIIANLNAFQFPDDKTRTDLAIEQATNIFKTARHGDVSKVLIIVTDGRATYPTKAMEQATIAKNYGIIIFALGVTDAINHDELEALASTPQHVFYSHNFQTIKNDLVKLAKQVCETVTSPPIIPTSCNFHLDLVIAIDGSNSMYEENFNIQKAAIANLIQGLHVTYDDIHVGLILFSGDVSTYQLSGNKQQIINAVQGLQYPDDATRTDLAIEEAQVLFSRARGGRVPKLLIIITDGRATYPQRTLEAAQTAKNAGISISVVGVTDAINYQELQALASNQNQVFFSADFQSLQRDVISAANEFCEYVTTALPPITTPKPTPKPVCHDRLDLVIALDGSNSMYENNFKLEKSSVSNMLDYLTVSPQDIRVGLILFSGDVTARPLSGNKAQIKSDLNGFSYPDDTTRTDMAIHEALNLFKDGRGGDVPKLLIIITDGRATHPGMTRQAANLAISQGIVIYVVGVTDAINQQELVALASSPQHVFFSHNFQTLQQDLVKAAKTACYSVIAQSGGGCTVGGVHFKEGENWYWSNCTKKSTCTNGQFANTRRFTCPIESFCLNKRDGVKQQCVSTLVD